MSRDRDQRQDEEQTAREHVRLRPHSALVLIRRVDTRPERRAVEREDKVAGVRLRQVVIHGRRAGRHVHRHVRDAWQRLEELLDNRDLARATDSLYVHGRAGLARGGKPGAHDLDHLLHRLERENIGPSAGAQA